MQTCSTCGRENPDDARFCATCGSPLVGAVGSAREERKVVTVLDLHLRVGINTGEALVSLDASLLQGEGMAAGDVVNTGALELYRGVGATAFIRDAERLLAAPA